MAHTQRDKKKLLGRVRRIAGQMAAVERALEEDTNCTEILRLIASARGAMNGLMTEVINGHLNEHVLGPNSSVNSEQRQAAEELMSVVRSYMK